MPGPGRALVVAAGDPVVAAGDPVAALLAREGWQVLQVTRADAALLAAGRFRPHLVVAGARGGGGTALLRALRRRGCTARLVALMPRPDARVQAAVAALGGTCLSTPVDARQLADLLRGPTTGRAAQGTPPPLHVPAERVPGAGPAAPPSGPADAYPRAGRAAERETWAARLPLHLARMAASAGSHPVPGPARDVLAEPRLARLRTLG